MAPQNIRSAIVWTLGNKVVPNKPATAIIKQKQKSNNKNIDKVGSAT